MSELNIIIIKKSSQHAGKIDWDTATYLFNTGKSPEEAAEIIIKHPPVDRLFEKPVNEILTVNVCQKCGRNLSDTEVKFYGNKCTDCISRELKIK
jgi:DNA-directed RNA polymerase subunit RPC12/RpoP